MEAVTGTTETARKPILAEQRLRGKERSGVGFAILCAVNGAFVPGVAKLTTHGADPFLVAVVTCWFAAAAAVAVLTLRGQLRLLFSPVYVLRLASLGSLGTGVALALFFAGAAKATAVETVLCLQVEPVYSLLLSWWMLGHTPSIERVSATLLILAGLAVALGFQTWTGSGAWYLLATPLCWQLSHLIMLLGLPGISTEVLAGARYLWGAIVLTLIQVVTHGSSELFLGASTMPWRWLALQGVVLSYGGTLLWYAAVMRIDLARATVLVVPTVPLLSLGASFVLLGEVASWRQTLGLIVAASGVYLFARRGAA